MRLFYEVDPFNRLVIKEVNGKSRVKKFRQVVHGRFKVDSKNRLFYEVSKSSQIDIPQKIKFSGNYSLDKGSNLIFTLSKWNNQCLGNRLRLKTKVIDANANELVFLVSMMPGLGLRKRTGYTLKLHGSWQADKNNRLTFGVKKEKDNVDRLTLFNAWKINKNNEIQYAWPHRGGTITLKGKWIIKDKYRLSYVLDKRIKSGFNFTTSLGQVVPKGRKTYAQFGIEVNISKRRKVKRNVIFTCNYKWGRGKKLILELSPLKEKKSAKIKLTKKFFDQKGLLYIETAMRGKDKYLGGGLGLRW